MDPRDPILPRGAVPTAFAPLQHYLKFAAFAAQVQRIMRIEEFAESAARRAEQIRGEFAGALVRTLHPPWGAGRAAILLVSHDPEDLRVAELAERALWLGPDSAHFAKAVRVQGHLLGFPSCCVNALSESRRTSTRAVELLRIGRRLDSRTATAEPVFISPLVPCRLGCPRFGALVSSISERGSIWIDRWAFEYGLEPRTWRDWRDLPALIWPDLPGQLVLFRPTGRADSEGVSFELVASYCSDPRAHALPIRGRLEFGSGAVRAASDGTVVTLSAGTAFAWDPQRIWDVDYWRAQAGAGPGS